MFVIAPACSIFQNAVMAMNFGQKQENDFLTCSYQKFCEGMISKNI